jgi:hypothetical protein
LIIVGGSVDLGPKWNEWRIDADRVVLTQFAKDGGRFIFTNGPGRETRLALTPDAVAVLFSALHYEITGQLFDPTTIGATHD